MRRFYGTFAPRYDWLMDRLYKRRDDEWRRAALDAATDADRVLEVGCGTGRTESLENAIEQYVSVDVSRSMLLSGSATTPVQGDVHALGFPDDSFDVVIGVLLMSTRINHERALAEMARVVSPDGRIVLIDKFRSPERHNQVLDRLKTWLTYPFAFDFDVDIESLAATHGLEVRRDAVPRDMGMIERVILA